MTASAPEPALRHGRSPRHRPARRLQPGRGAERCRRARGAAPGPAGRRARRGRAAGRRADRAQHPCRVRRARPEHRPRDDEPRPRGGCRPRGCDGAGAGTGRRAAGRARLARRRLDGAGGGQPLVGGPLHVEGSQVWLTRYQRQEQPGGRRACWRAPPSRPPTSTPSGWPPGCGGCSRATTSPTSRRPRRSARSRG
nr:hypothetical protein [Angustibacter aerolatus]